MAERSASGAVDNFFYDPHSENKVRAYFKARREIHDLAQEFVKVQEKRNRPGMVIPHWEAVALTYEQAFFDKDTTSLESWGESGINLQHWYESHLEKIDQAWHDGMQSNLVLKLAYNIEAYRQQKFSGNLKEQKRRIALFSGINPAELKDYNFEVARSGLWTLGFEAAALATSPFMIAAINNKFSTFDTELPLHHTALAMLGSIALKYSVILYNVKANKDLFFDPDSKFSTNVFTTALLGIIAGTLKREPTKEEMRELYTTILGFFVVSDTAAFALSQVSGELNDEVLTVYLGKTIPVIAANLAQGLFAQGQQKMNRYKVNKSKGL